MLQNKYNFAIVYYIWHQVHCMYLFVIFTRLSNKRVYTFILYEEKIHPTRSYSIVHVYYFLQKKIYPTTFIASYTFICWNLQCNVLSDLFFICFDFFVRFWKLIGLSKRFRAFLKKSWEMFNFFFTLDYIFFSAWN